MCERATITVRSRRISRFSHLGSTMEVTLDWLERIQHGHTCVKPRRKHSSWVCMTKRLTNTILWTFRENGCYTGCFLLLKGMQGIESTIDAFYRWLTRSCSRTFALHKHRPISLYPTIHPPSLDEVPADRPIAVGLEILIALFKIVDDTFINLWNRVHSHANHAWISQLQTQLTEAVPAYLECTEAQAVEIRVTQHWLRAMSWQLCVCQGLVSSVANEHCMTFKYPIDVSRDLLTMTHQFSPQSMEVHGARLVSSLCFDLSISNSFGYQSGIYILRARSVDPCHFGFSPSLQSRATSISTLHSQGHVTLQLHSLLGMIMLFLVEVGLTSFADREIIRRCLLPD